MTASSKIPLSRILSQPYQLKQNEGLWHRYDSSTTFALHLCNQVNNHSHPRQAFNNIGSLETTAKDNKNIYHQNNTTKNMFGKTITDKAKSSHRHHNNTAQNRQSEALRISKLSEHLHSQEIGTRPALHALTQINEALEKVTEKDLYMENQALKRRVKQLQQELEMEKKLRKYEKKEETRLLYKRQLVSIGQKMEQLKKKYQFFGKSEHLNKQVDKETNA